MIVTPEQLTKILPYNHKVGELCQAINSITPAFHINTINRMAAFLAQCAVESVEFTSLQENLNYGPQSLMSTWKHKFPTIDIANSYAHQPEKIANYVYANEFGNGDEASGDGWRYRGRGAIQLTGHNAYKDFATFTQQSIESAVSYCETLQGAVASACYFWSLRNINLVADRDDIREITHLVNGPALLALDKRTAYYNKAKGIL